METILILGARSMQVPAIRLAKEMGLRVVVIDPQTDAVGFKFADEAYVFDLGDMDRCLDVAKKCRIGGVMTLAADYPLPMVACICEDLGLSGLSVLAARLSTNKKEMRRAFAAAKVPSPLSIPASTIEEAIEAFEAIGGPTIFKPTLSHGGRGVTRVLANAKPAEVNTAFDRALQETRADGILVEEFVDGPEFSVEGITFDGKTYVVAVTDKLTSGPPHYVEIGHNQPSRWPTQDIQLLIQTAIAGVKALQIDWAASHSEIRLGPHGPCVMEIGARLGGGYIATHLVPLSTGLNVVKAAISLALGKKPDLRQTCHKGAAVRFITSHHGIISSIHGIEDATMVSGVHSVEIYINQGDEVIPLVDARGRIGHVICTADDAVNAIQLAEKAKERIVIEVS